MIMITKNGVGYLSYTDTVPVMAYSSEECNLQKYVSDCNSRYFCCNLFSSSKMSNYKYFRIKLFIKIFKIK